MLFFISFLFFVIFPEWSYSLGAFADKKESIYEVDKNKDIRMKWLVNAGSEIYVVQSIRHFEKKTIITCVVKETNHQITIFPSLKKFQLKKITGVKMKKRIEMSGVYQMLTLFIEKKEFLIIGDQIKSSYLKGGYRLNFFRKNLEERDFQVMLKKEDKVHYVQPQKAIFLQIDGDKWELYVYQFKAFDIFRAKVEQAGWSVEEPLFNYDYILVRD